MNRAKVTHRISTGLSTEIMDKFVSYNGEFLELHTYAQARLLISLIYLNKRRRRAQPSRKKLGLTFAASLSI